MVFHSHLGNQTAQTSSHIVALQGLLNYDLSVVALLGGHIRPVVGYRPLLVCSREEGVSPVGSCSGRCNQSRTVEKRLRVFVLGLGH